MLDKRLKELLNERDLTISTFAEMCEVPVETIRNIYYGKTPDPKLSTAQKMANALNISINCLVGECPHSSPEKALLQNYRNCGKHGRSIIELIAKYEASAVKKEREGVKHKIPCIVPHGDIRKGIIYEACETIEIETSVEDAFISIQMITNDLAPTFCKDDILLLENRFPANGEMASFYKDDRVYIRKFVEEDKQYKLKCLHQQGEDIIVKRMDEVDYIGTIIGAFRG